MEILILILLILIFLTQLFVIFKLQKSKKGESAQTDERSEDELYDEARKVVLEEGKASASFLQRKLNIGYARTARLLDMLEEEGIVGPAGGAKPREVLKK